MDYSLLGGYDDAKRTFLANVSPRYRSLDNLDAWAHGRQYDGRPDWFSLDDRPLWEKAPCIVYLLALESMQQKVSLVLGEERFPLVTSSPGEDDEVFDDELGLDKESSETLDRFIKSAFEQSRFCSVAREVLQHGQEVGSAVAIFGVRNGKLFVDTMKAQWCEPDLDIDGNCTRLEIRYPYLDPYKAPDGKWKVRVKLYRRVIDAQADTVYKPVEADKDGRDVPQNAVQEKVVHGFGFCPVRWYPFMRGCSTANQIDGKAVHALFLDEIQGLDFALSQRHRAALFGADPLITEVGVTPGYSPTEIGRTPVIPFAGAGEQLGPGTKAQYAEAPTAPARKKGSGVVWQYENPETRVEMHCLPGDAFEAVSKHADDLRQKLCDMLSHVPLDPESIKFAATVSGKAMEALRERELTRCGEIRDDFGDRFLVPAVKMLLRICLHFVKNGGLKVAGLKKVAPILSKFIEEDPTLRLVWGSYSKPAPDEEQMITATVSTAKTAGLITDTMALTKLRSIFAIGDIAEALEALRKEKLENQANAVEHAGNMAKVAPPKPGAFGAKEAE